MAEKAWRRLSPGRGRRMPNDTALHKSANEGDESEVDFLIKEGKTEIDAKGAQGRTPLHRALGSGHKAVVELLLDAKADITIKDSMKRTGTCPLAHTVSCVRVRCTTAYRRVLRRPRVAVLHWVALGAAEDSARECLQVLCERGDVSPLINLQSSSLSTPLHCAITRNHLSVVKALLEKGADVTLKDDEGKKPADLAKASGSKDMQKLVKKK